MRLGNICDVCDSEGTAFRCEACDYDVCSACLKNALKEKPERLMAFAMDEEASIRVVRHEGQLRKEENYLAKTRPFVQRGETPLPEFDEEVQCQALRELGFAPDSATVERYRALVKGLTEAQRREVLFLAANDRFFRPEVSAVGRSFDGSFFASGKSQVTARSWLDQASSLGRRGLFVLASTST